MFAVISNARQFPLDTSDLYTAVRPFFSSSLKIFRKQLLGRFTPAISPFTTPLLLHSSSHFTVIEPRSLSFSFSGSLVADFL